MRSSVCTCACHELKTLPDLPDNRTPNAIFNTSKRDRGRTKPFGEGENNLRFAFVFLLHPVERSASNHDPHALTVSCNLRGHIGSLLVFRENRCAALAPCSRGPPWFSNLDLGSSLTSSFGKVEKVEKCLNTNNSRAGRIRLPPRLAPGRFTDHRAPPPCRLV